MKLGVISNPAQNDFITVHDVHGNPRQATTGEDIVSGESVICEAGASGSVVATDPSLNPPTVTLATFAGDDPADVVIDWIDVISVDEYYNGGGQSYDITVDSNPNETFTIVG